MKLCYGLTFAILITGGVCGTVSDISVYDGQINKENKNNELNDYHIDELFSVIQYFTNDESSIDISLNRESFTETCYVITPNGAMIQSELLDIEGVKVQKESIFVSCRITIGTINNNLLGDWKLCGKSDKLRCQPVHIQWHNSNFPPTRWFSTNHPQAHHIVNIGETVNLNVADRNRNLLHCHAVTPDGEDLVIKDDVQYPYITRIEENNLSLCALAFDINSDTLGGWVIYGLFRSARDGQNELRRPVVFNLDDTSYTTEEPSDELTEQPTKEPTEEPPEETTVEPTENPTEGSTEEHTNKPTDEPTEGSTEEPRTIEILQEQIIETTMDTTHKIVISKEEFVENESCYLITPDEVQHAFSDGLNIPGVEILNGDGVECGVILNVRHYEMIGQWVLIAKAMRSSTPIERRQPFTIRVEAAQPIYIDNLMWNVGQPLDITLGSNDTVYCKIIDNSGHTMYDNFGQCHIVIDRVTVSHRGTWKMYVGLPGTVQLQSFAFYVEVLERGNKPVVTTSVATNKPSVLLTCSLPSTFEVNACKFRDPQNNILIAAHSVGQGGYAFNGSFVRYESNAGNNDCTLRLINPTAQDLGLWRCGMDTTSGTFYGFLTVLCPFTMQDPEVAASVITEPVLEAENKAVVYLEDEPVVMSCFIPTHVKYCYFRARNGTVYNVFPGMPSSENFGYVGSGLDAGECGIRFNSLSASESGIWSCHVGLEDTTAPEQRQSISVSIRAQMDVRLMWHATAAIVEATVNRPYTIDYCRFVRINGQGFTMDNLPNEYTVFTSNSTLCSIFIRSPNLNDLNPWTVAVKVMGQDGEISRTTGHLLDINVQSNIFADLIFWLLFMSICLAPVLAATALIPKKNREWTYKRASYIRNSFRKSWNHT